MSRLTGLLRRGLVLARASAASSGALLPASSAEATCAAPLQAAAWRNWAATASSFHSTASGWATTAPAAVKELAEKDKHLLDKDIWDEAWAHDPRFGTVETPIEVPSLLAERIIGVTDPQDDTLVIWSIIRENEPPRQLVDGGEFFVLKRVDRIPRVGDVLGVVDQMIE